MTATRRGWFAIFVAVVFSAGVGTGLLLRGFLEQRPEASTGAPGFERPMMSQVTERLARELDLDNSQRQQLERIFESRRGRLGRFREDVNVRMQGQFEEMMAEIDQILTPEQRRRHQALVARMRSRLRQDVAADPGPRP